MPDPGRSPDVTAMTSGELGWTRRDLAVSLALVRPGSLACGPIVTHIRAIDIELAQRSSTGT